MFLISGHFWREIDIWWCEKIVPQCSLTYGPAPPIRLQIVRNVNSLRGLGQTDSESAILSRRLNKYVSNVALVEMLCFRFVLFFCSIFINFRTSSGNDIATVFAHCVSLAVLASKPMSVNINRRFLSRYHAEERQTKHTNSKSWCNSGYRLCQWLLTLVFAFIYYHHVYRRGSTLHCVMNSGR
jgi:hypothetical protein